MARIRTIKPEFFRHAGLFDAERETGLPLRLAFAGLWCAADREGRFKWRPRELKLDALPFDDVDFSRVLDALVTRGHVAKYARGGVEYGCIPSWREHQFINNRETPSVLPPPEEKPVKSKTSTRAARVPDASGTEADATEGEGKGKEGKGREGDGAAADPSATQPPVASIPLIDGSEFDVPARQAQEWAATYPAIDVIQKLREARAWCLANPTNRKTRTGAMRFLVRWLSQEQNKAPRRINGSHAPAAGDPFQGAH